MADFDHLGLLFSIVIALSLVSVAHISAAEVKNERLDRFFRRFMSFSEASISPNTPEPPVSSNNGEYLMKISIGTPPFDPQKLCDFSYGYGDGSLAQGVIATETLTLNSNSGQPASIPNIVFGCGHNNSGTFNENEMGLFGTGGRPLSLTSQIMSTLGSGRKFSQCLVPFRTDPSITSKIIFGPEAEVSGSDVVSTPLVTKDDPTYYFVTLDGISVGDKLFPFSSSSPMATKGNVFIDAGTPPTLLPRDFYNRLVQGVKEAIPMEPVQDPDLQPQLCYRSATLIDGPILTAHFDGADVQLKPLNTFISPKEGVYCFAMQPIDGDTGIFGNFVQMNFLIGFDLDGKKVSFKAVDCTKQQ
ncbi:Aspartic proteinase CDR1 [Vitis vinifera]|uniref:Aspartic proteinase CDR1 n=1 Tax=Vitis vinifera TaxID=29760 RepID=A0A438GL48_VITVI|nr:Aspartic proteinase CDR1 [Vitis vinifera]